jgi:glycosyltransferase involved in cell wall biosynthesis
LTREYDLSDKPVLVEYIPPVNVCTITSSEAKLRIKNLGIQQPFLLCFGTLEPRKNLVGLLRAYALLDKDIRDTYALVLGGGKGWKDTEILETIKDLQGAGASVYQTGYVSDQDRAALFMEATAYVLTSYYEGFGMQLLEAMSYKTPMLVSDIPVLHEVAVDSAIYCPTTPEGIAKSITRLVLDDRLQRRLVENGAARLKDFSWPKVANEVYLQIKKAL